MSDEGGTDNPAFTADECTGTSASLENSHTESLQHEQKSAPNGHSLASQEHCSESNRKDLDTQHKTETRIEVPDDTEKTASVVKVNGSNGIHGNGNNNDASFLNTTVTSIQANDGKKEQIEAVNLELVSMRPYTANGNMQTKGQEACELPSDPYEEYFVPVNEHRKYIRGEKLYVTKDKRSKGSYWRRVACWAFALTVLGLALVIAILAATGVILTQEVSQPLDNDHQRSLDGVKAAGSQEFIKNPPATPSPETSTFPPWPTTDDSILKTVAEALDGSIWLDNLPWVAEMADAKSRVYRDVATEIEHSLRDMLHPAATLSNVKVYNISSNGEVLFRISYPPSPTPEIIQDSIEKTLRQRKNMIAKYHVSRMNVKRLIDECQYRNLNCSESCRYDYTNGIFICDCLPGRKFDESGRICINVSDLSDVSMDDPATTTVQDIVYVQGRSRAPEGAFEPRGHDNWMHNHDHHDHHYHEHGHDHHDHEHHEHDHDYHEHKIHHEDEGPVAEPSSTAEPISEPEPSSEQTPEPEPAFEVPEPKSEPQPSDELELRLSNESPAEPEPTAPLDEPEPSPELTSDEKPAEPEPTPEPTAAPITTPSSSSIVENVQPEISSASEGQTPGVSGSPEPEPSVEPSSEAPEPELSPTTAIPEISVEPTMEPKSVPEPILTDEPSSSIESISEPEPSSEPSPEITSTSQEISTEPKSEPEPTAEPIASSSEPITEPKSAQEPSPIAEPTVEPSVEPSLPTTQSAVTPQSSSEIVVESSTMAMPPSVISLDSAEPKVEPIPSSDSAMTEIPSEESTEKIEEAVEMFPTAIPKTVVINRDDEDSAQSTNKTVIENETDDGTTVSPATDLPVSSTAEVPTASEESSTMILPNSSESMLHFTPVSVTTTSADGLIADSGFPKVPESIIQNVEPFIESPENSTQAKEDNHSIIPELTPESIDPYDLIRNTFGNMHSAEKNNTSISSVEGEQHVVSHSEEITTAKPVESITVTDEKHLDDMSPFLPDVVREKEVSKKAPRLDKDEDFPNPFEPHVDDAQHQFEGRNSDAPTTVSYSANGSEFTGSTHVHLSHDVQQAGTTREDVGMLDTMMTTTVESTLSDVQRDAAVTESSVVDIGDLEIPHTDGTETSKLTNDTGVEQGNNPGVNDNRPNADAKDVENSGSVLKVIPLESEIISEATSETPLFTQSTKSLEDVKTEDLQLDNKLEHNVEDLYNDIIDESISKKFESHKDNVKFPKKHRADFEDNKEFLITTARSADTAATEIVETTTESMIEIEIMTTTTPEMMLSLKPSDDNKFTTEIPIIPMEIQQDAMAETTIKADTTIVDEENTVTGVSMTTQISTMETKTTAQVPILPEELQTTEASVTTEKTKLPSTVMPEMSASSTDKMNEMSEKEMTTTEIPEITTTTLFQDIKPVSEDILDEPTPESFDRTRFFPTTEEVVITHDTQVENSPLKVIPLDTAIAEQTQSSISVSSEVMSTSESSVPRLKIVEITSASKELEAQDNLNTNNTIIPKIPTINLNLNNLRSMRPTPEIIPVYEEVEDNVENPMLRPLINLANIHELLNSTIKNNTADMEINEEQKSEETTSTTTTTTTQPVNDMEIKPKSSVIFSKCNAGQFQCTNGTARDGAYCVSLSAKCDSENDCSDGSDEANCEEEGCPGNFQCRNGQCLGRHLVCNGIVDCDDSSDEDKCSEWTCHFDEFQCSPKGRCIPDLWRCNGRPDCEDHRDEYSCSESCGNDEYLCPNEKWCIPQTWRCNGMSECADGEDEKLCDCALDQFKCQTGGCVALDQVCDGVEHCPDRSDEWHCLIGNMTMETADQAIPVGQPTLVTIKTANNTRLSICADDWTKNHSDSYCRSLGYFGSETTQTAAAEGGVKLLKLKADFWDSWNIVTNLEPVDECKLGQVVKVSCQEFSCGSADNEGPTARLVGGTPAGEGQWSSVALLKETKNGAACTASVIGPMHALASYSCIHKSRQSNNWELLTGRDLQKSTKVKNIIPYPQVKYNQFLYENDIALIQLEEPLVFSRNVSAVCLPSQQFQPRALCVTAGWGFPMDGDINLKLKFLPIPIYNTDECNATSHYAGFISKTNICAGFTGNDKGTCYNDEGAPLMCATESGRWEIQGLLSHHSRCSRGHPAIYSSLSPAISWLQSSIPALQVRT